MKIWKYLDGINHKRIARVIKRFLGHGVSGLKNKKKLVKKADTKLRNLLKIVRMDLEENMEKIQRGNWILKEGKNMYQKVLVPNKPFRLWTGDWKEFTIPVVNLKVYIFIILDAYTKIVVGWHLSMNKTELSALRASEMALEAYSGHELFDGRNLIHHVDRGSAYTSEKYREYWKSYGVHLSYSDPGSPTQNGYSEGYMSLLSRFFFKYYEFESYQELKDALGKFIGNYNSDWKHGKIDYLTPKEKLKLYEKEVKKYP